MLNINLYEFIKNTRWTNTNIENEERIECSILINISKKTSNDEYEGSIQIQSTRPIYGTSYKSTLFNYLDNKLNKNITSEKVDGEGYLMHSGYYYKRLGKKGGTIYVPISRYQGVKARF